MAYGNRLRGGHVSQSPLVNASGNFVATGLRRSTRIEKSVPLIVLGQNRLGEPFVERTVAVSLNMHGCRYHSRHDYGVGTWVTLQMVGLISSEEKPATARAMVRSVQPPGNSRELQQVGVELETPANVWGIVSPPVDWLSARETSTSTAKLASVIASAQESATKKEGENLMKPEPKVSEITSFPSSAASRPPVPPAPKVPEAPRPPRVVVTPDQLISALQGKLQQEAEKAVQAAVAKQANDVIREALGSIDDARRSSVREVQELFPKQLEAMKRSLKQESAEEMAAQWKADMQMYRGRAEETAQRLEKQAGELRRELANAQEYVDKLTREIAPSIPASLKETASQAASDFESATAVIADRRYERLLENTQIVTQDALLKLNAHSAEAQAFLQSTLNSRLDEFRQETALHVNMALAETKERAVSMLSSLDAESQTTCEARRQALETEVARSAERAAEQFHKGIKAFLYTCLVAAVGAMDEHSKSTLDGLRKDDRKTPGAALSSSPTHDEDEIISDGDGGSQAH
jgi:hypothetical protein